MTKTSLKVINMFAVNVWCRAALPTCSNEDV